LTTFIDHRQKGFFSIRQPITRPQYDKKAIFLNHRAGWPVDRLVSDDPSQPDQ
jgi:hypothetical protein